MGRAPCCDKNGLKKGPWTPEEDQKLIDYIQKHGHGSWRTLPKNAGLERCGKSCRLRWANYLRPDIKRGRFSFEEEETIIQLHSVLGNKWSTIASRLPGRTDNEIKNYWNTHIRKRLLKMGIDPVTHTPRLDLLDLSTILRSSLCNQSQQLINNMSGLLGLQSLVNPDLMSLLTTLISSQHEKTEFVPQTLQENQLPKPQMMQTHFSSFQPNQLHSQVQETPISTTSNTTPYNMQLQCNTNESNLNTTNFSSQNSQQNHWNDNVVLSTNLMDNFAQQLNQDYGSSDQFLMNSSAENSNFQSNDFCNQDFGFTSVLPTPSSSQTPLNSSMYVNSSTEDERDSYCSDLLKFEIPDILDINGFM